MSVRVLFLDKISPPRYISTALHEFIDQHPLIITKLFPCYHQISPSAIFPLSFHPALRYVACVNFLYNVCMKIQGTHLSKYCFIRILLNFPFNKHSKTDSSSIQRFLVVSNSRSKRQCRFAECISSLLAVVKTDYAIESGGGSKCERCSMLVGMSRGGSEWIFTVERFYRSGIYSRDGCSPGQIHQQLDLLGTVDKSVHPREKVNGW